MSNYGNAPVLCRCKWDQETGRELTQVVGCIQMGSVGASLLLWAFHFGLTLDKFQIYTDFKLQFQLYTPFFLKKVYTPIPPGGQPLNTVSATARTYFPMGDT
jgi:hypothetical protein